jgi:hypothetical protein
MFASARVSCRVGSSAGNMTLRIAEIIVCSRLRRHIRSFLIFVVQSPGRILLQLFSPVVQHCPRMSSSRSIRLSSRSSESLNFKSRSNRLF